MVHRHKKKSSLRKIYFSVIGKYDSDILQGHKIAPDLLEAIMKPSRLVKE